MLPKLFTLVVNWNLREDTLACLRSLFAAGAVPGRIIVVDNGSTDGSAEAIRVEFGGKVILIETGNNLGLTGGINAGLPAALERGAEWIFILNNDTLVESDLFERFEEAVRESPGIAVWGPRIVYHATPNRVWFLADRRIGGTLLGRRVPENGFSPELLPIMIPADFISGCAMLVRREVFERAGEFDELLFLFAEDVDFCLQASRAGFQLAAAPHAAVRHKVSLSTDRDKPWSRFLRIRNQIWVYRRYSAGIGVVFYFAFTTLRLMKMILIDLTRGDAELIPPALRGWAAGWFSSPARPGS